MEIRTLRQWDAGEILPLYAAVGWTNYTARPAMLADAFARSLCALGAYEEGRLVGLVRAVGDGSSVVLVQDLLVHPDFQRRGAGRALMRALLGRFADVYQFLLLTDDTEASVAFYRSLGLTPAGGIGCTAYVRIRAPQKP